MDSFEHGAPDRAHSTEQQTPAIVSKKSDKQQTMLRHFASGVRIDRFQAEKIGDHVLPSTICTLQTKHQITFKRETVSVPTRFGGQVRVSRYWLDGADLERAQAVVGDWQLRCDLGD